MLHQGTGERLEALMTGIGEAIHGSSADVVITSEGGSQGPWAVGAPRRVGCGIAAGMIVRSQGLTTLSSRFSFMIFSRSSCMALIASCLATCDTTLGEQCCQVGPKLAAMGHHTCIVEPRASIDVLASPSGLTFWLFESGQWVLASKQRTTCTSRKE